MQGYNLCPFLFCLCSMYSMWFCIDSSCLVLPLLPVGWCSYVAPVYTRCCLPPHPLAGLFVPRPLAWSMLDAKGLPWSQMAVGGSGVLMACRAVCCYYPPPPLALLLDVSVPAAALSTVLYVCIGYEYMLQPICEWLSPIPPPSFV